MRRFLILSAVLLALPFGASADEHLREVQAQLKTQGFYYGEVTGESTPETTAALKRYQIRNGLEVTGALNKETLDALRAGPAAADAPASDSPIPGVRPPQQAPPPAARPSAKKPQPPVNLRKNESVEEADKNFLRREEREAPPSDAPSDAPGPVERPSRPPAGFHEEGPGHARSPALEGRSLDFAELYAETPYATAPPEVQVSTLRRAQAILGRNGFYHGAVDGAAGPGTEEALLTFQRVMRLPLTGRLDLETLNAMHLLPGRGPAPLRGFSIEPREGTRVYRGVWIH